MCFELDEILRGCWGGSLLQHISKQKKSYGRVFEKISFLCLGGSHPHPLPQKGVKPEFSSISLQYPSIEPKIVKIGPL